MKKILFVLTSILIFSACSSPASEEAIAPEAAVDSTAVDSVSLEETEADSAAVK